MTPVLQYFHEQHKERRARMNSRAYQPPRTEVAAPAQPAPPEPLVSNDSFKQAWRMLGDNFLPEGYVPSAREIQDTISDFFGVSRLDILSSRRTYPIVQFRQLGFLLCKELTPLSTIRIGRYFGGKDHTTVLHGINKARSFVQTDSLMKDAYETIMAHFGGSNATA